MYFLYLINFIPILGLRLCGAEIKSESDIALSSEIESEISVTSLVWKPLKDLENRAIKIPVYRNGARQDLLFTANVNSSDCAGEIFERGIAITTAQ